MFCREQAARFAQAGPELEAAGARLVAIGNGTSAMARDFVEQFQLDLPVYTDPSRESFRQAGLKRNFGIGLGSIRKAWRALRSGHRQGRTRGDPWQQGGVLVIGEDGRLRFRHIDSGAGHHIDPGPVLDSLSSPGFMGSS